MKDDIRHDDKEALNSSDKEEQQRKMSASPQTCAASDITCYAFPHPEYNLHMLRICAKYSDSIVTVCVARAFSSPENKIRDLNGVKRD